ncbi:hypothetical protein [Streptomyces sp. NPDC047000]|uniref:hypothetical protein n=1 Tax=Streptomyces sp. NPDC047000 TaxID=3155474 RepID=UPI0033C3D2B1
MRSASGTASAASAASAGSGPGLAPVRARILRDARAEADAVLAAADADAAAVLREAGERAAAILDTARARGAADAGSARAALRARARRSARDLELAARRESWEELCRQVVRGVEAVRHSEGYPELRERLAASVRAALGAGAEVTEAPGGGVLGSAPGRRTDCSLAAFAQRVLDGAGAEAEELWAPWDKP